jgi:Protein of unknown function (DUF2997)
MPKEIKVTVNPDGTTTTDFSGYQGPSCLDAAERLRQLLAQYGIESQQTGFTAKPELAQTDSQQTRRAQSGGHSHE